MQAPCISLLGVVSCHEFWSASAQAVIVDPAGARDVAVPKLDWRQLHVLLEVSVPGSASLRRGDNLLNDRLPFGLILLKTAQKIAGVLFKRFDESDNVLKRKPGAGADRVMSRISLMPLIVSTATANISTRRMCIAVCLFVTAIRNRRLAVCRVRLSRLRTSRHPGQPQHVTEERALAQEAPQGAIPLHATGFMAQSGRGLVLQPAESIAERGLLHCGQRIAGAH